MLHYQATYIVSPGTPGTETSSLALGYLHLWLHPAQVHLVGYHDAYLPLFEQSLPRHLGKYSSLGTTLIGDEGPSSL